MNILGISAYYHDSAAALIKDGKILAAAQEERFTRKKHDPDFPTNAVNFCLNEANITLSEVDYIAFYEKPLLKFERLLETFIAYAPFGFSSFRRAIPVWVQEKLFLPRLLKKGLENIKGTYKKPFIFPEHHESHAASAFFPSPFEKSAILTVDGVGEWTTTSIGYGEGNKIKLLEEQKFPHSLGLLYSAFTYYCGFRVNSGEYKLMGLAPYGQPKYQNKIEKHLIDIKEDGSYQLDMSYFGFGNTLRMTNGKFHKLFGRNPRRPETELQQFHMDIASSIQKTTEKIVKLMCQHAKKITNCENICLAGGVALNCVANGKIITDKIFKNVWIQPAAGDAGGALGAALMVWYQLLENERKPGKIDIQQGSLLGPTYSDEEIAAFLVDEEAKFTSCDTDEELCKNVANLIANEKVVGWFQGKMEFGPRALGARSIIGDARSLNMQKIMNLKIKFRESFRPFAPSILKDNVSDFFELDKDQDSPYMLVVAPVNKDTLYDDLSELDKARGLSKLMIPRSKIQAVTHVDCSARVQTVDKNRNPLYYKLIQKFKEITGSPVLINTSFNVRGEPIVCTLEDAYRCFLATNMDVLVLGHYILLKSEQKNIKKIDVEAHLKQFALD